MDRTYALLLALACGGALACGAVLVIGAALIGGGLGALNIFNRGSRPSAARSLRTRETPDLRAAAQNLDFEEAVARYSAENPAPPSINPTMPTAQGAPPPVDLGPLPPVGPRHDTRRRSTSAREWGDDEVFGGMLDEDGDGDPDF